MPTPRGFLSAGAVGERIYVIGGATSRGHSLYRTVEAYDPVTDTWQARADMPTARFAHAAGVWDGKIYVFGGAVSDGLVGLPTVEAYDPAGDRWTARADMPTGVCLHATAVLGGRIYVLSGASGAGLFASVGEYDPLTDLWKGRSPMLSSRWGLAAAALPRQDLRGRRRRRHEHAGGDRGRVRAGGRARGALIATRRHRRDLPEH